MPIADRGALMHAPLRQGSSDQTRVQPFDMGLFLGAMAQLPNRHDFESETSKRLSTRYGEKSNYQRVCFGILRIHLNQRHEHPSYVAALLLLIGKASEATVEVEAEAVWWVGYKCWCDAHTFLPCYGGLLPGILSLITYIPDSGTGGC